MPQIGGISYSDPIDFGQNKPYDEDSVDILADRKGGWLVRHKLMGWENGKIGKWIEAVPNRMLAGLVHDALCQVADKASQANKVTKK